MCFLVVRRAVGQNEVRTASQERRTGSGVRKVKTERRKGGKNVEFEFLWINLLAITPSRSSCM